MCKKLIYLVFFILVLTLTTPLCSAAIGPITSVTVDNPDGTIPYNLLSITVGDYTINADQLVVGTTTVGLTGDGEPWPEMDNLDIHDAIDTGLGTSATTMLFDERSWIDTNGDNPDFFMFESHSGDSSGDNPQIAAILPGGVTGQAITLSGSSFGPTGYFRVDNAPDGMGMAGQQILGISFQITDLLDSSGNPLTNDSVIEGIALTVRGGADITCLCAVRAGDILVAHNPSPSDGTIHLDTWISLSWSPGDSAVSHDVYIGESFDDVNDGAEVAFVGNQAGTFVIVGFPGMALPDGLAPGTTYYWRIDEVEADGTTIHKGNIWSFMIPLRTAHDPGPPDGAEFVATDVILSWTPGLNSILHTVYFGDNFEDVNSATMGAPQANTTFTPGTLELDKTYYWRVDESAPPDTHKGDIWSFTTLPVIPINDPNLVGWWKFEAGSGTTVIDFSGHGNHGTIVDNVQWVPGQFNLALEFLGDDQGHVELPAGMVNTAKGSVTMWVNTDLTGNEGMFWYGTETDGDGFGGQNEIHIHNQDAGTLGFALEGSTDVRLDGPLLAGAGWTHIVATWDLTDGCILYANGAQVDFVAHNNTVADLAVIRLGRPVGTGNGNRYHDGFMDDVRLFDHAISAEQIGEIMTKGEDPLRAGAPNPLNGSLVPINLASPLNWSAGENASEHDVYFDTDRDAVNNADPTDTTGVYRGRQSNTNFNTTQDVEWGGGPYYWRIDEVNTDGTISKGSLWSFTVADFIVIEDFESYNDLDPDDPASNRIFNAWIDGFGDATNGSLVGYANPPFAEQTIVHGGGQSMPFAYDNAVGKSEATLTLTSTRDWTVYGVDTLTIWFIGEAANAAETMYVVLNGTAAVTNDNPNAAQAAAWTAWNINLTQFADQGVNLANVNSITIGLGNRDNPVAGGSGMMFFDDIRLSIQGPYIP